MFGDRCEKFLELLIKRPREKLICKKLLLCRMARRAGTNPGPGSGANDGMRWFSRAAKISAKLSAQAPLLLTSRQHHTTSVTPTSRATNPPPPTLRRDIAHSPQLRYHSLRIHHCVKTAFCARRPRKRKQRGASAVATHRAFRTGRRAGSIVVLGI
jgi:hypothetical protein